MINLPLIHRGKVRDVYQIDDHHLLMVASDRLSAFDVVLPNTIPLKGALLSQISNHWFDQTTHIVPNHLTNTPVQEVIPAADADLKKRAVVVKKLTPLPVEAIVRGYLIGSGWKDYLHTGEVCGIPLPPGLQRAEKLPEPIFTPSSKAAVGDHDENISFAQAAALIGQDMAKKIRDVSLALYRFAAEQAQKKGLIIADTKFEFGLDDTGQLVLMDEVLTPDSSRFWDEKAYRVGTSPESFDKQFVRDYLETLDWDKTPPGPVIPDDIIQRTAEKYHEAHERITGRPFRLED